MSTLSYAKRDHRGKPLHGYDRRDYCPLPHHSDLPTSVLTGQVLGSLIRTLISVTLVIGVALLIGFRTTAGPAAWIGAIGVIALFTLALTWIAVALGLVTKTPAGRGALVRQESAFYSDHRHPARTAAGRPARQQRGPRRRLVRRHHLGWLSVGTGGIQPLFHTVAKHRVSSCFEYVYFPTCRCLRADLFGAVSAACLHARIDDMAQDDIRAREGEQRAEDEDDWIAEMVRDNPAYQRRPRRERDNSQVDQTDVGWALGHRGEVYDKGKRG
jgi:hypothetical protein